MNVVVVVVVIVVVVVVVIVVVVVVYSFFNSKHYYNYRKINANKHTKLLLFTNVLLRDTVSVYPWF